MVSVPHTTPKPDPKSDLVAVFLRSPSLRTLQAWMQGTFNPSGATREHVTHGRDISSKVVCSGGKNCVPPNTFTIVRTSTSNFDCLIHTVFTITCPAFRVLEKAAKNMCASTFRRQIWPRVADKCLHNIAPEEQQAFVQRWVSNEFLNDRDVQALATLLHVHFCNVQSGILNTDDTAVDSSLGAYQPPSVYLIEDHATTPQEYYAIYGDGSHFEGLARLHKSEYVYAYPVEFCRAIATTDSFEGLGLDPDY
jgi:hypothetical protein